MERSIQGAATKTSGDIDCLKKEVGSRLREAESTIEKMRADQDNIWGLVDPKLGKN